MALPVVLLALALTSALIVGGMYAGRSLESAGRVTRTASGLQGPAEQVLVELVASWDTLARAGQPVGATSAEPLRVVDGAPVSAWVTRLTPGVWWLVAEAQGSDSMTPRRRVGLLAHGEKGPVRPVPGRAWTQLP